MVRIILNQRGWVGGGVNKFEKQASPFSQNAQQTGLFNFYVESVEKAMTARGVREKTDLVSFELHPPLYFTGLGFSSFLITSTET